MKITNPLQILRLYRNFTGLGFGWPSYLISSSNFANLALVEVNSNDLTVVLQYGDFFEYAVIFAGNINCDDNGDPIIYLNAQVSEILETKQPAQLQQKNIKVLMGLLNNHEPCGWSCQVTDDNALKLATNISNLIEQYQLDGIFVDDEYSSCSYKDNNQITKTLYFLRNNTSFQNKIIGMDVSVGTYNPNFIFNNTSLQTLLDIIYIEYYSLTDIMDLYETKLNTWHNQKNKFYFSVQDYCIPCATEAANFIVQNNLPGIAVFNLTSSDTTFINNIKNILY